MKFYITCLLLLTCVPFGAYARFDETTVQCDARYGKPTTIKIVGTDQVRYYTIEADRLILRTPPERAGGTDVIYYVTWEREP